MCRQKSCAAGAGAACGTEMVPLIRPYCPKGVVEGYFDCIHVAAMRQSFRDPDNPGAQAECVILPGMSIYAQFYPAPELSAGCQTAGDALSRNTQGLSCSILDRADN
jgi:hypothetical protein